ncbi:DUF438 domain-containing protein [Wansuia hejianensis]|uniref:DUF438 domain-containing protein n=1 Tax=Wansuia hejianensis TaxID=2763667 RepID=A0A926F312_9FIRM|nr:DUF438 domain-containing protein [Wansuia hejianensis]MBC8591025.1 DUF438 domain-containing protein [Wansuia hejianensis]
MSELLNNREYRQEQLKEVIKELHGGKSVDEVKEKFAKVIEGVSPKEISEMEVQLVKEGLPIEEIQNLCDVHAAVFKGTLDEIHHPEQVPGHPIYTMKQENQAIKEFMENTLRPNVEKFREDDSNDNLERLIENINLLWDIDKHYSRKENLIFPYLEKYGVTAPPKVMWGVDDEVREKIREIKLDLTNYKGNKGEIVGKIDNAIDQITEMIFKEESILFPMSLDTLTEDEWIEIYKESDEIGYALISPETEWKLKRVDVEGEEEEKGLTKGGYIKFDTGVLNAEEITAIMEVLPGELSFVDKNNIVKFFTKGEHRIFARTKAVIGRAVENCHPHTSVHMVDKIIDDFKTGKKDSEDFWIQMGDMFVLIRFFAVRDKNGEYLGTLEYVQNIASMRELTGEKRLLSD